MKKKTHIIKDFIRQGGTQEGTYVYTVTNVSSGKTEVVIKRTISERYPVQKLDEVLGMAEIMNSGNGRRVVSVDDLMEVYKGKKEL